MSAVSSAWTPGVFVTRMPRWAGGRDVDMIDPRAVVGDELQPLAGPGQKPRVDPVGERRDEDVGALHRLGERIAAHRACRRD